MGGIEGSHSWRLLIGGKKYLTRSPNLDFRSIARDPIFRSCQVIQKVKLQRSRAIEKLVPLIMLRPYVTT